MRVDAKSAGDAEVVVGLHDLRREAERVELGDDFRPARASRHTIDLVGRIDFEPGIVESDRHAVARQALAAHRVAGGPYGDAATRISRRLELRPQSLDPRALAIAYRPPMLDDGRWIESARVIQQQPFAGLRAAVQSRRGSRREGGGEEGASAGEKARQARQFRPWVADAIRRGAIFRLAV